MPKNNGYMAGFSDARSMAKHEVDLAMQQLSRLAARDDEVKSILEELQTSVAKLEAPAE